MEKKAIGILGGMGPLATCDLMQKIINHQDAKKDQDYLQIFVDCNTNIPDRTGAILHGGEDPVPQMTKSAVGLEKMGADVLIMPCNTAHYFLEAVAASVETPFLHMPRETAKYLREQGIERAAVLATDGTVQTGIYDRALKEFGVTPMYPAAEEQKIIMSLIYDCVKAGKSCAHHLPAIMSMGQRMMQEGAQAFVLACTELPIAFDELNTGLPTADPTDVLACAAVRYAGGTLK